MCDTNNCLDTSNITIPAGSNGTPGLSGKYGGYSSKWLFSNSTAVTPASTYLRLNNASPALTTALYVNDVSVEADMTNFILSLNNNDGTGNNYGLIRLFKEYDSSIYADFLLTGLTDNGPDFTFAVTYIGHNGAFSLDDNVVLTFAPKGTKGNQIIDITYANLAALKGANNLAPSITYHITDREYYIDAITTSQLSNFGHRVQTILTNAAYQIAGTNLGTWNGALTPIAGDTVVWGGRSWINTSGSVGSSVDIFSLSGADWSINTSFDTVKIFRIDYDFDNDWITRQFDERGNVFGFHYLGPATNLVDYCDWGNTLIASNRANGILNNYSTTSITRNETAGNIIGNYKVGMTGIDSNKNSGVSNNVADFITGNINMGSIENNTAGSIEYNSNNGFIQGNNVSGVLGYNDNTGNIEDNIITSGNLQGNLNTGDIGTNTVPNGILSNTNNGGILENWALNIVGNSNNGSIITNLMKGTIDSNSNIGNISGNDDGGPGVGLYTITVSANENSGEITENSAVYANCTISFNVNSGEIFGNIIAGDIIRNGCGKIRDNLNQGAITGNTNNGDIIGNTSDPATTFSIIGNANNGGIGYNNSTANIVIQANINNGYIGTGPGPNPRAANVTDATVNK